MKRKRAYILFLSLLLILPLRMAQSETPSEELIHTYSYVDHEPIVIITDQNFTDYGFPGAGTEEDPYRIENYKILSSKNTGIYIASTTKHFTIRHCYINVYYIGIRLYNVASFTATIFNNTCEYNSYGGILIDTCDFIQIINNTCSNNNYVGIMTKFSLSTIVNNTCVNNQEAGILCSDYSDYSSVLNNYCKYNNLGLWVLRSDYLTVSNNTFSYNTEGALCGFSSSNLFIYNLMKENFEYGVRIQLSSTIIVHHNAFVDNNKLGTSQAQADSSGNVFYDTTTSEGNYWSDWSGIGNYSIDGAGDCVDLYPLGLPPVPTIKEYNNRFVFFLPLLLVPLVFYLNRKKL